ncbi:MAG: hypothetical protein JWQ97_270 [Phenylobacterium sp.]|nr:hypothetical protein [Phenylobacterium sp.]
MDLARFRDLLARHGADLGGWPPVEADAAIALMSEDPAAQDLFAALVAADSEKAAEAPDTAGLVERIMSVVRRSDG